MPAAMVAYVWPDPTWRVVGLRIGCSSAPMSAVAPDRALLSRSGVGTFASVVGPIPASLAAELFAMCRFSLLLVVEVKAIFAAVMVWLLLLVPAVPSSEPL